RSDTYGEGRLEFPFSQFRSWDGGRNCRNGVPEASDLCPQELVFGSQGMGDPFRTGDDYAIMQQCVVCGSLVSRVDDGDEEYGAHGDEDHDEDYDGEDKGDKIFLVPRGRNLRATAKGAEQRFRSGVGKGLARNKKLRDGRCNGPRACQCADGPPAETKVSARFTEGALRTAEPAEVLAVSLALLAIALEASGSNDMKAVKATFLAEQAMQRAHGQLEAAAAKLGPPRKVTLKEFLLDPTFEPPLVEYTVKESDGAHRASVAFAGVSHAGAPAASQEEARLSAALVALRSLRAKHRSDEKHGHQ
ncbi:unnamed protein product, partial [Symbiodinium microadriaticum]